MRLWTIHPELLDAKALVAVWREGLLTYAVLRGATQGYKHHPQLRRFRDGQDPLALIRTYLAAVLAESKRRYSFDGGKITRMAAQTQIIETSGQLLYEWKHLKRKLRVRCPSKYRKCLRLRQPVAHPLFCIVDGAVREWESPKRNVGR